MGRTATKDKANHLTVASKGTNDWERALAHTEPWTATIKVQGIAALFFNRWSVEAIDGAGKLPKGAKVPMDPELMIYRGSDGTLSIPAEHFRMALVSTGRFYKDPRSTRRSLVELLKAGIIVTPELASLGVDRWDYLDTRRVRINRGGAINKTRPAMQPGWQVTFTVECTVPEYIRPDLLHEIAQKAGRFNGLGDFRPTYGRFQVMTFEEQGQEG